MGCQMELTLHKITNILIKIELNYHYLSHPICDLIRRIPTEIDDDASVVVDVQGTGVAWRVGNNAILAYIVLFGSCK